MTVNDYQPHIMVLPEDEANSDLANGFVLEVAHIRRIQILPEAGGWTHVRDAFVSEHVRGMRRFPARHVVLLLDCDGQINRINMVRSVVPADVRDRVFIFGVRTEPEDLKRAGLGKLEAVGEALACECRSGILHMWSHALLVHNVAEANRFKTMVGQILF